MKINEFMAVEGRDDTERVRRAVECNTIEANDSIINEQALEVIRNAQQSRGVIVLTDPDFPRDRIRSAITEHAKGVKHAYIDREKAEDKEGKIGVEHADLVDIKEALMHVNSPFDEAYESVDKSVLIELGLVVGKDAERRRETLSRKLRVGHSNGKQLLKKLDVFGYTEADVRQALEDE